MLGTFLPWAIVPLAGSFHGTMGYGWFTFAGFGIALLVSLSPGPSRPINAPRRVIAGLMGLGCAALGAQKVLGISEIRSNGEAQGGVDGAFSSAIQIGNGLWLILFCGIALAVLALALRDRPKATSAP